jgi:hypothetical protein
MTLRDIIQKFRTRDGIFQRLKCENILGEFSETFGGWDFRFPTDSYSNAQTNFATAVTPNCGTCSYTNGAKWCYEAKINGQSYLYDMWDINYALYGTLQRLCGAPLVASMAKVQSWKRLKGEYTDRVWFWFKFGYDLPDPDSPTEIGAYFKKIKIPESDPRYASKCQSCPGGAWRNPSKLLEYTSYISNQVPN